jgi:hypothetical protein
VAEPVALHLVVAHLCHELGPERGLLEVAGPPAVGLGEAPLRCVLHQRLDELQDLGVLLRAHGRRADVVEFSVLAVEPEEQRREVRRLRLPAHSDDGAVRGLVRLHLCDRLARAGPVGEVEPLRDHAVQPRRLERVEPGARLLEVGGRGRELEALGELLELPAPLRERELVHWLALPEEHVERDELGGDLRRELADPALRGVQPHLHQLEVEHPVARDHDLAVERGVGRQELPERPQLGEVAE